MKPQFENMVLGAGLIVFFTYVLFVLIPAEIFIPAGIRIRALSPAFFPRVVSILMIGLGAGIVVQSLLQTRVVRSIANLPSAQPEADDQQDTSIDLRLSIKIVKIGFASVLLFCYYWLIGIFGMLATSIVMMPVFSLLYGYRKWKLILPLSFVLAVSLYYFFAKVAHISIPKGSLFG